MLVVSAFQLQQQNEELNRPAAVYTAAFKGLPASAVVYLQHHLTKISQENLHQSRNLSAWSSVLRGYADWPPDLERLQPVNVPHCMSPTSMLWPARNMTQCRQEHLGECKVSLSLYQPSEGQKFIVLCKLVLQVTAVSGKKGKQGKIINKED